MPPVGWLEKVRPAIIRFGVGMYPPLRLLAFYGSFLAISACGRDVIRPGGSAGQGGLGGAAGAAAAAGASGSAGASSAAGAGGGGTTGICTSRGSVGFAGMPGAGGTCTDDKSCNEDPALDTKLGICTFDRICNCGTNPKSPFTGRCLSPGDDGTGCAYDRTSYSIGTVVPVLGCGDRCSCTAPGAISCPPCACLPCALTDLYFFSISAEKNGYFYMPGTRVSLARPNPGSDTGVTCSALLPPCGTPDAVDTSDLYGDIAD